MLRALLLAGGLLLALVGLLLLPRQPSAGLPPLVFGLLLVVGTWFERWRYKGMQRPAETRGEPTGERFIDPETGGLVEVYYDSASGERSYVKVADRP